MAQLGLTERELRAWRTSFQMVEMLRTRIEQQLQADGGLSNADYSVLALLSEAPGRRMRAYELSRVAGWEKSRMHHQLTRMERRGQIARERCGSRGIDVVLTTEGHAALKKAVPGHAEEVRRLFIDRLTPEELEQFADIAAKILDNLQADQPPTAGHSARRRSGAALE
ncbi:MarR family winged helix-turn-helix transcriptional regulator [Nonomuraea angiospora]